jgi:ribosomal-protein-alanine N-acetyltransferase
MHVPLYRTVPQLETRRLVLKEMGHNDAAAIHQLFTDERVVKTFGYRMGASLIDAHDLLNHWRKTYESGEGLRWGMYLKSSGKLVGNLGFKNLHSNSYVSIGYALMPYYWRTGLTSEALNAVIAEAFYHLHISRIEATVLTINTPSVELLKKLDFKLNAHLKNHYFFDDAFHDVFVYMVEKE